MMKSILGIWRKVFKSKPAVFGMAGLLFMVILALFPKFFTDLDPYEMEFERIVAPCRQHPFGTDDMGRDIYTRFVYGTRVSLFAGVTTTTIALSIGTLLGMFAGFFGKITDEVIMRISDIFLGFPPLIMAMAIVVMVGQSITNAMLAIGIVWWPQYTRLVRVGVASTKEEEFVEAARSYGAKSFRLLLKHILPQNVSVILVKATVDVGFAILFIAALSFLGLGARPPLPEWGILITQGRSYIMDAWWISTFPGIAVGFTVLCLNLVGDWLRDLLDPTITL